MSYRLGGRWTAAGKLCSTCLSFSLWLWKLLFSSVSNPSEFYLLDLRRNYTTALWHKASMQSYSIIFVNCLLLLECIIPLLIFTVCRPSEEYIKIGPKEYQHFQSMACPWKKPHKKSMWAVCTQRCFHRFKHSQIKQTQESGELLFSCIVSVSFRQRWEHLEEMKVQQWHTKKIITGVFRWKGTIKALFSCLQITFWMNLYRNSHIEWVILLKEHHSDIFLAYK